MAATSTSQSGDGELELQIAARGAEALLTLRNRGSRSLAILSHVDAGERHYDWFTVRLANDAETRLLRFYDDRNESGRVIVELPAGDTVEHALDLAAWALRKANGAQALARGAYRMCATYRVAEPGAHWTGAVTSPTIEIVV